MLLHRGTAPKFPYRGFGGNHHHLPSERAGGCRDGESEGNLDHRPPCVPHSRGGLKLCFMGPRLGSVNCAPPSAVAMVTRLLETPGHLAVIDVPEPSLASHGMAGKKGTGTCLRLPSLLLPLPCPLPSFLRGVLKGMEGMFWGAPLAVGLLLRPLFCPFSLPLFGMAPSGARHDPRASR